MHFARLVALVLLLQGDSFMPLQAWEPATAPLMTPWADDVDPANVLSEYPRPTQVRQRWQSLNGVWQFAAADVADAPPHDRQLAEEILVPFPWESALSGIRRELPTRRAWYRRTFTVPDDWVGQRIWLHFGAVDYEATVYVNGRCVALHRGGYDAFSADVTAAVNAQGDNVLVVGVWDPGNEAGIAVGKQNNPRFSESKGFVYTPSSGIWQTVWIEPVGDVAIQNLVVVPSLARRAVEVTVSPDHQAPDLEATIVLLDGEREVGRVRGPVNRPLTIDVPDPHAWSPADPFLYDLRVELRRREELVDEVTSYAGLRDIAVERYVVGGRDGIARMTLNSEPIYQVGPLDQGYWPDGIYTAPTDEALRWDITEMKRLGYNMVRKHIKVEPERWYYWCDREGLLVWQDMPSSFAVRTQDERAQWEVELARLIRGRRHHPSIVNWVVFNENWGTYDVPRNTLAVQLLDPSRLVTGNSGIEAGKPNIDYEVGHVKDHHVYRPPVNPQALDRRAVVLGEFGAIGYLREGHVWDTDGPWVHYNFETAERATAEYERFFKMLHEWRATEHLSAVVYTQWTDVENEMNGIYTYDRRQVKLDPQRVTAANRSLYEQSSDLGRPTARLAP